MSKYQLFPVFEMPEIGTSKTAVENKYKQSVAFDYSAGDFQRDGANKLVVSNGKDTYIQWCIKTAMTERYDHMAYSGNIGIELEEAMQEGTTDAVKSSVERTITEALMVNIHTEYVRNFVFVKQGDHIECSFTVKGKDWEEQQISIGLPT